MPTVTPPSDLPPSDLQDHLGYWLRMVSNAVSRSFARRVEAEGVTVAEWVLLRVLFATGDIAPSALAARMAMTRGAISKLADRLEDKHLLRREPDPTDGRAHKLALTPAGQALVPRLAALADANDAAFFAALTEAERRQLKALLAKIAGEHALTEVPID